MSTGEYAFSGLFDDGFVEVTRMGATVLARIGCASVRERQAMIVRETLTELARGSGGRLVVGLQDVESMSASCLGDFVALKEMCGELGGRLVLFGLSEDLREGLASSGLLGRLDIADDQESAVSMLRERDATLIDHGALPELSAVAALRRAA